MYRRFTGLDTIMVLSLLCELHNQDCVLGRKTQEHYEPNLRQDIDRHAPDVKTGRCGKQAHGHDQHNGQWYCPALILSGEDEEDEQGGSTKYGYRRNALLLLLMGEISPLIADALREDLIS
jgi:hypothetical protein